MAKATFYDRVIRRGLSPGASINFTFVTGLVRDIQNAGLRLDTPACQS